jgi:hypothetical protein
VDRGAPGRGAPDRDVAGPDVAGPDAAARGAVALCRGVTRTMGGVCPKGVTGRSLDSSTLAGAMTHAHVHYLVHPMPLLASNTAFFVIFGIFVVALLVLIVIVLTWAIRRDRAGRASWMLRRQQQAAAPGEGDVPRSPRP